MEKQTVRSRLNTLQDYQERMGRVRRYLEQNLDRPVTLAELARVACFSHYHFHRLFAAFMGEPLFQYIRRLRLERAAVHLVCSERPVTDIALAAGYETPSAFNKAFLKRFGKSPTAFRLTRAAFTPPAASFNPVIEKECSMEPRIVDRPETPVVYVRKTGPYAQTACEAWSAVCKFAYSHRLVDRESGTQFIGVSHDDPDITDSEKLRYDACITVTAPVPVEGEVQAGKIAAGQYAVFLHRGPHQGLKNAYREIFRNWLPASGHQLRDVPCFEVYLNTPERTKPENLKTEIWVPIEA